MKQLDSIPWLIIILLCASLGLAPFFPLPHIWEKLKMLQAGELTLAIDWLDLTIHGVPWILLVLKLASRFCWKFYNWTN